EIREDREARNIAMCDKLKNIGMDVSLDEISEWAKGDIIARPHIARFLVKKGYVSNVKEAFEKYLQKGAVGYVARFRAEAEKCISLIRENGGLPVLAHPWQTNRDIFEIKKLAAELKDFGLWGIECYSNSNKAVNIYDIMKLAEEIGLYVTAGSDFHGDAVHDGDGNIGIIVPDDILPWARICGGL
ncbi:MAG: phosphatase, partial [Synergistaceae bacterium]|nr:phosphatase [Synergistaceae bacterium]